VSPTHAEGRYSNTDAGPAGCTPMVLADTQVFRSRDLSCSEAGLDALISQALDD